MKNRIVENWLTNASERAFKVPFCQLLISKGYELVHNTRDGPFEQGKDVIAINKQGEVEAFQLKRGNISQSAWAKYKFEVEQLVEIPIIHPSVPKGKPHIPFLVTNGQLSEETRREIDDRNKVWESKKYPKLRTWVGGQLVQDFQKHFGDYFPVEVEDLSTFLTLFKESGTEYLNKELFATFMEGVLAPVIEKKRPAKTEVVHAINSMVVIASYIFGNKYKHNNHVALVDGWVIVMAYAMSLIERYSLASLQYRQTLDLITDEVEMALEGLYKEVIERDNYVEGDVFADVAVYRTRISILSGYLCAYALLKLIKDQSFDLAPVIEFLNENTKRLVLLGEGMSPLFFNIILVRKFYGDLDHSKVLTAIMANSILTANDHFKGEGLPDPYHGIQELLRFHLGLTKDIQNEGFSGISYSLESIVMFMTWMDMREQLEKLWLKVSHMQFAEFKWRDSWEMFIWNNRDSGTYDTRFANKTESWARLVDQCKKLNDKSTLPKVIQDRVWALPIFLCVYPHRATPSTLMNIAYMVDKIST